MEGGRNFQDFWRIAQKTWKEELFEPMVISSDRLNTANRTTMIVHSAREDPKTELLKDIVGNHKDGERLVQTRG